MRSRAALCAISVWLTAAVATAQPGSPPPDAPPSAPPTAALPPVEAQPPEAQPPAPPAVAAPPAATAAAPAYPAYGEPPPPPPSGGAGYGPAAPPAPPHPERAGVHTHDSFYVRFGIGGGSMSTDLTYEPDTTLPASTLSGGAPALHLMLGGTVSKGLVLGGTLGVMTASDPEEEAAGTASSTENTSSSLTHLGLLLDWFPDEHGGFHVGGSLGLYTLGIERPIGIYDLRARQTLSGGGGQLFLGYDLWVGDNWSLGGLLSLTHASTEEESGGVTTMGSTNAWTLQFSALYH